MKTLKSIDHALTLCDTQLTAQDLLNGNIHTKDGWTKFNLSDDLSKDLASLVSETLGGRYKTKERVRNSLYYGRPQHWGLKRVVFVKRRINDDRRKFRTVCQYIAGQDYVYETAEIRKHLKN